VRAHRQFVREGNVEIEGRSRSVKVVLKPSRAHTLIVGGQPEARETQHHATEPEEPIPPRHEVAAHVAERKLLADFRVTRFLLNHARTPKRFGGCSTRSKQE
jgi:hypothetical protein